MNQPVSEAALSTAIAAVDAAIVAHDQIMGGIDPVADYADWRARHTNADQTLLSSLIEAGAKIRQDYRGSAVSLDGIRATSTGSLYGAACNWRTAARARLAATPA